MYGIIHNAVKSTVLLHADEDAWEDVLKDAELTDQHFLSPANYSDDITFRLVDTVANRLGLSQEEALFAAGRHWCDYATGAGYGSLFSMAGSTVGQFLANLDRMHNSLKVTLPEASMPSFELIRSDEDGFEVVYRSKRAGLARFVEGILAGLFVHYNEPIDMAWEMKADGVHFVLTRAAAVDGQSNAAVDASSQSAAA